MSLPDRDLDPEDVQVCEDHGQARPCRTCRDQYLIEQAEANYEERESSP